MVVVVLIGFLVPATAGIAAAMIHPAEATRFFTCVGYMLTDPKGHNRHCNPHVASTEDVSGSD